MDTKLFWLRRFSLGAFMIAILVPATLFAQFEQKLSLNVSAGYFNTLGWSGWEENWEEHGPSLMPNFKGGVSIGAGLQYNFNRHFSIEFQLGYRFAPGWYFDASPEGEDEFNYLYYEVYDNTTSTVLASGDNYMDLANFHFGIAPRYYFIPGSKINPFVYAGVTVNYTDVYIENKEYEAYKAAGIEDQYEDNPELYEWFDYQVSVGLMAGAGVEFELNENWGLFAMGTYHFIPLDDEEFYLNSFLVNYHDLSINLGARFSLLKSKDL
jgi:opacity protein-like surface antigen